MKRQILAVVSALTLAAISNIAAADHPDHSALGKDKAVGCQGCHGADGISAVPTYPNLAGQKEAYLIKQMKAFKDGTRKDPTMNAMAAPLSDEDIAHLAAYYANLK